MGVTDDSLKWFQSYFESRKQLVSLDGFESTEMSIRHGVPQGSTLATLLLVIFINDMPLHIDSETETELYADDTTIMTSADVNYTLQSNLYITATLGTLKSGRLIQVAA